MASAQYGDMSNWDYPNKQNNAEQINEFVSTYLYPFLTESKNASRDKTCQKLLELIMVKQDQEEVTRLILLMYL